MRQSWWSLNPCCTSDSIFLCSLPHQCPCKELFYDPKTEARYTLLPSVGIADRQLKVAGPGWRFKIQNWRCHPGRTIELPVVVAVKPLHKNIPVTLVFGHVVVQSRDQCPVIMSCLHNSWGCYTELWIASSLALGNLAYGFEELIHEFCAIVCQQLDVFLVWFDCKTWIGGARLHYQVFCSSISPLRWT